MSEFSFDKYPWVKKAIITIATDQGHIHRGSSEEQVLNHFSMILNKGFKTEFLSAQEEKLKKLNEEEFETICCGETSEMEELGFKLFGVEEAWSLGRFLDVFTTYPFE